MSLIHATYTPTGSIWTRLGHALFTAYVNVHIRLAERQDPGFYVQLDQLEIE